MKPDVIIVTGSRDWTNRALVEQTLAPFPAGTILIHGCCRGLDQIAAAVGRKNGFTIVGLPYFEDEQGREARNESMFAMAAALRGRGHHVRGFAFPLAESRGTWRAIGFGTRFKIMLEVVK